MKLLGIDPGTADHNGWSIYETQTQIFDTVSATDAFVLLKDIHTWYDDDAIEGVVLEDPNLDSSVFNGQKYYKVMLAKTNHHAALAAVLKMGQGVGMNKGLARLFHNKIIDWKIPFIRIAPSKRRRITNKSINGKALRTVLMPTKITSKQFKEMTGYTGMTNEHGRDSACMLYQMTENKFNILSQLEVKE